MSFMEKCGYHHVSWMIFICDNIINPIVSSVGQKGVIGFRWYWLILLEQLTEEY